MPSPTRAPPWRGTWCASPRRQRSPSRAFPARPTAFRSERAFCARRFGGVARASAMKIWIDLANSPHALLFAPVARSLEELGHEVVVTARDNAQTVELARSHFPSFEVVGHESPS